jgi:hypothetical protein
MDFGQHGAGRSGIQAHGVLGRNFSREERKERKGRDAPPGRPFLSKLQKLFCRKKA